MPAIETNEFTRSCLPAEAYPVLWKLATRQPPTPSKRSLVAVLRAILNPTTNHTTNNNH